MYDNLFEPLRIGPVTVPNRVARAAHGYGLSWPGSGGASDLLAYHEARARGGVGLHFLAGGGVHPSSSVQHGFYDRSIIPGCARLAEAVHRHGSLMFAQLFHRGHALPNPLGAPWSASDVTSPSLGITPVPMTQGIIEEVVAGFATAAGHVRESGLDGVEIQAAHGYLVGQFLSPATNRRTDGYGGSTENRSRLLREIIDAVRATVGDDFPIGIRVSADEGHPDGLHPDEALALVRLVEDRIDYLDVSLGSYYRIHQFLAPMDLPLGYELPTSEILTRATELPTVVTGRIATLDHASEIVASGRADMVSMVRALIADPDLVNKARTGREHEIRPCIGTAQGCYGRRAVTGDLSCVVNIAAGREARVPAEPAPATRRRTVLVVGGGPAGMEAARAAAQRGHSVVLHEMTRALGGQVAIGACAPGRGDYGAITRWLADELNRLGVSVKLSSPVDVDTVLKAGADEVVIATGALPRRDGFQAHRPRTPIPGFDRTHVYSSWAVFGFGGRAAIGRRAVVFDDSGRFEALSVADALLSSGAEVTLVSAHGSMAARVDGPEVTVAPTRERLLDGGLAFLPHRMVRSIEPDQVLVSPLASERIERLPADTVVLVGYNEPQRELADALTAEGVRVHLIGDAAGSTTLQQAITAGAELGRRL